MNIEFKEFPAIQIKFSISDNGKELGHAFLIIAQNDLHNTPFGLLEDVFILEEARGQGLGNILVQKVIQEAKERGCYKLIATSRFSREFVHWWYERLGFKRQGLEFRINFSLERR